MKDNQKPAPVTHEETPAKESPVKETPAKESAAEVLQKYGIPENLLSRFIGVYFIVSAVQLLMARVREMDEIADWKDYVEAFPLFPKLVLVLMGAAALTLLHYFVRHKIRCIDHLLLMAGAVMFGICLVWRSNNYYLGIAASAVAVVFVVYALGKIGQAHVERLPDLTAAIIIGVVTMVVTVFVAVTTIADHLRFGTATYDMGIFVQMFYSLKEHMTAVTTCERGEAMSHFAVHSSFIYYLLLPFYAMAPKEETLLTAQAILATSGVIPLFLIARKRNFKGFSLVSICLVYLFYAGIILPCFYDFHENCFLPTLLMWLLYAVERRQIILFYVMAGLTCIVKEDAPLYVICIAFFFLFEEKGKQRLHGLLVMVLSGVYFFMITKWLAVYGDGEFMASTRFGNLTINQEDGFVGIIRNVLVDPGYFFYLMLDEHSLVFFVQTMLPLLFLPFFTKKIHRFLLIVPYVIMNLVIGSGYKFAAEIGFQYIFGPSCLLIYMMLRNAEDIPQEKRHMLTVSAAVISVITLVSMASGSVGALEYYRSRSDLFQAAEACIDTIPQDGVVAANTYLLPHAADREEIYAMERTCFETDREDNIIALKSQDKYDFYLLSKRDSKTEAIVPLLEEAGYTVFNETEGFILIYVSPRYLATH